MLGLMAWNVGDVRVGHEFTAHEQTFMVKAVPVRVEHVSIATISEVVVPTIKDIATVNKDTAGTLVQD